MDLAEEEGRLKNAAFYVRAAEFLTPPDDEKLPRYEQCRDLFERAFEDESYKRYEVPYADGPVPRRRRVARQLAVSRSPRRQTRTSGRPRPRGEPHLSGLVYVDLSGLPEESPNEQCLDESEGPPNHFTYGCPVIWEK